ncbi:uncharacterized protein L201_000102 [Kwoniella dendrophila CBS 6074]|uniref:Nuclear cap-binding protein subunit 1 n=1 Tax=Kwoniella dendrophila CBS 6074 TaxID=1295534 RepID=A0AAX4JIH7_9TREE
MSYQNGFNQMMGFGNPYAQAFNGQPAFGSPGGGGYGRGGGRGRGRDDRRGGGRGRGGGGGGGGRDRPPIPENSNARMRKMVIKLGDDENFEPVEDTHRLSRVLKRGWSEGSAGVCEGFRISVTQQPHKHSYLVVLLLELSRNIKSTQGAIDSEEAITGEKRKADDAEDGSESGREVLEDLSRALRGWVEGREWQNVRLGLQFFSSLVPAGLVTSSSLLGLYKSLLAVLEEVGGGGDRAERAVRAVGEGLIRSGKVLYEANPDDVENLVSAIEGYIIGRRNETKALIDPFSPILASGQETTPTPDTLDNFLSALHALRANFFNPPESLPRHWESVVLSEGTIQAEPYDIAPISMPPEMYAVDAHELDKGEGLIGNIQLFADEVVPSPDTLEGWVLRSLTLDLMNIYEVNRKECATLLLSLRKFLPSNTFKPLQPPAEGEEENNDLSTWSPESLVISTLLNGLLTLPKSAYKSVYYASVITELCKLSPNTVAPPVGRAVRKIFSYLGTDGLDVEITRRVAEWFSVHLSNFGFQWMWKEWIPELELPASHPKRAFMRRVTELEVRLAYYDRILDTLPEPMQAEGAGVISSQPPEPVWAYEKPDHPLHNEAKELLQLFRSKATVSEIRLHIESIANSTSGPGESLYPNYKKMIFETLLHLGSRSFSHFLNATERYLDLLRYLTSDQESRKNLLQSIWIYWKFSNQLKLITLDKYLQYGILEGSDIINFLFLIEKKMEQEEDYDEIEISLNGNGWTDEWKWEILKMTLEKHIGRVQSIKNKLKFIEREDEMARARRNAEILEKGGDVGADDDIENDMTEESRPEGSKAFNDAQTSLDIQASRLEKLLILTVKQFVSTLLPGSFADETSSNSSGGNQGLKSVLTLLESGEESLWSIRAKFGWYKEFVRLYSTQLIPLAEPIESTIFSNLTINESTDDIEKRAIDLVKSVWNSCLEI